MEVLSEALPTLDPGELFAAYVVVSALTWKYPADWPPDPVNLP
jgi:hypothetical protein